MWRIGAFSLTVFYVALVVLVVFLFSSAIHNRFFDERIDIIKDQRQTITQMNKIIVDLRLRNKRLKRVHKWAALLEQVLPPCTAGEWDLMAKQIEEWKKRYGNPKQ